MKLQHIRYADEEESDKQKEKRQKEWYSRPEMPVLVPDEDSDDEQDNDPSPKKIYY